MHRLPTDPHIATRAPALLLVLALLAPAAQALESDRTQPIMLEADRAELDESRGTGIYHGHVLVTQGSLELTAETLTMERSEQGERMLAEGTPATYRQQPDGGGPPVRAKARRIEYLADRQLLILTGDAELVRGGDTFHSGQIVYDIANNRVSAGGTAGDGQGRVRIVIQPQGAGQ